MCRATSRLEWESRIDAILPVAGSLAALVVLLFILVI
jgi:hypothetical protein